MALQAHSSEGFRFCEEQKRGRMTAEVSHFDNEAWIGFAFRLVPDHLAAKMQAHLDDGCAACIHAHKLWGMVAEFAAHELSYEPPREVTDAVKAAFPLAQTMSVLPYIALPAKMTFDSAREPLPAGFRGGSADVRHLLYETVNFLIGLCLERDE